MNDITNNIIYSCLVLFNPEDDCFLHSVKTLLEAGSKIVIYDNSNELIRTERNINALIDEYGSAVNYFKCSGNIGLAAAFNKMVKYVQSKTDAEAIVFFDQDTTVTQDLFLKLVRNYRLASGGGNIGVYSALAQRVDGTAYRVRKVDMYRTNSPELLAVKFAPSSFSLIPMTTFDAVGIFHDDFFIDHIDVDFCSRCWRRGYVVLIDKSICFQHRIGHGDIFFRGRPILPVGAPERHYYQVRNILLSAQRGGAPWTMAISEVIMRFVVIGVIGFKMGCFWRRYRFAFSGLKDAILRRGGAIPLGT